VVQEWFGESARERFEESALVRYLAQAGVLSEESAREQFLGQALGLGWERERVLVAVRD
jgi:hypothetical protein